MNSQNYDYSAFDNRKLHFITFIYAHVKLLSILAICLIILIFVSELVFVLGLLLLFLCGFLFIIGPSKIPGSVFARVNKLSRPFLTNSSNYYFIYNEYKNMKKSALFKTEQFVWGLNVGDTELGCMFIQNKDVVVWARLAKDFPHMVVDGTKNNRLINDNVRDDKLPPNQIDLEGDFPSYFKVYIENDQQVLALQILSPDRMATLIDKLGEFDIEIKGNHLKIYAVNAQRDSKTMKTFVETLEDISKDLKIDRINKIK